MPDRDGYSSASGPADPTVVSTGDLSPGICSERPGSHESKVSLEREMGLAGAQPHKEICEIRMLKLVCQCLPVYLCVSPVSDSLPFPASFIM